MNRLVSAALYRRRDVAHPAALGMVRIRSNRLTGRWEPYWRWASDSSWLLFPVEMLGRLEFCTTASQVKQLLDSARPRTGGGDRGRAVPSSRTRAPGTPPVASAAPGYAGPP